MAAYPVSTILEKLTELIVEYMMASLKRQFKYVFCYNENIQNLRDELQILQNIGDGVRQSVRADQNNLRVIGPDVEKWIKDVEDVTAQAGVVLEGTGADEKGCLHGKCPNCWARYSISRQAVKKTGEVTKLKSTGKEKYAKFSSNPVPAGMVSVSSAQVFEEFDSRMLKMQEIMKALKDDQINVIGICGMAGVGKTTMVKNVMDRAKFERLFDGAAMTAVTEKNLDLMKIQAELAIMLGLDLKDVPSKDARAKKLWERLSQDDRIIIVLDDVWETLNLRELGIPSESKKCKVILTSRNSAVCSNIGAEKIFEVQVLTEKEAWDLFKETAGVIDENTDLRLIAKEVAKECQQLPLAIVLVGRALKNKELPVWRNALVELGNADVKNIPGVQNFLYSRIELSYKLLESDQARSLLLLCSLFPEDHDVQIEYLVRYGVGLKLFEDVHSLSLAETRDRIDALVDLLKSHFLLLAGDDPDTVRLHDVVRDFCISVARKSGQLFLQRHGGEMEKRVKDYSHKDYTAISVKADFTHLIPSNVNCPTLKVFQVLEGDRQPDMAEELFNGMKGLKVLDLKGFAHLRADFQPLGNLRTLFLEGCDFKSNIFIIGSLNNLEILSFYDSCLHQFPSEIGQLNNLKLLDLRFREGPRELPPGVLLNLKKLEELYLGASFQVWSDEDGEEGFCESISEVRSLSRLTTFQVCTSHVDHLQIFEGLLDERLSRFEIIVTSQRKHSWEYEFRKRLELKDFHVSVLSINLIQALFRRTEEANLRIQGMKSFTELDENNGFKDFKTLSLEACNDMEYLIDTVSNSLPDGAFQNLECLELVDLESFKEICSGNLPGRSLVRLQKLSLARLDRMRHLWRGPVQPLCLCKLKIIFIGSCGAIKSLFSQSIGKCLLELETLTILHCKMIEAIILEEQGEDEDATKIEFPRLKHLDLLSLPRFKSFSTKLGINCSDTDTDTDHESDLQPLFSDKVILPSLEMLAIAWVGKVVQIVDEGMQAGCLDRLKFMSILGCRNLLNIASSDLIKHFQELEKLEIRDCDSLQSVFDFEGMQIRRQNPDIILSKIESMRLGNLPKLIHIWKRVPGEIQAFQNLRLLEICFCESLRCLFSPSVANMLVNLQELTLGWCNIIEAVINMDDYSSEINVVEDSSKTEEDTDGTLGTDQKKAGFPRLGHLIAACCMPKELVKQRKGERIETSIGTAEEKAIDNDATKNLEKIVLPRLNCLELKFLENLEMFCSGELAVELPLLERVLIIRCAKLKTFCAGKLSTPKLRKVQLGYGDQCVWKNDLNSTIEHISESRMVPENVEDSLNYRTSQVSTQHEIEAAD